MNKNCELTLTPAFRAMADLTRLKILLMLEARPRSVNEIVSFFALSQPTISRHLQTLMSAGLVKRSRSGQRVLYALNVDTLKSVCLGLVASFDCCGISIQMNTDIKSCESCIPAEVSADSSTIVTKKMKRSKRKGGQK